MTVRGEGVFASEESSRSRRLDHQRQSTALQLPFILDIANGGFGRYPAAQQQESINAPGRR